MMKDFLNKIILSDCLDVMKKLPDKSIDLVLTDPPYGIKESFSKNKSRGCLARARDYGNKDWDKTIPKKEIFDEIFRISKNQIIFGGNYFSEYLKGSPCWLVWDKDNGNSDFADCELAYTSFKTAVRIFRYRWQGFLQGNMREKDIRIHPTQKPLALFKWIVERYSNPNDIVFDPFSGSGTTACACYECGRPFICVERDIDYHLTSNARLDDLKRQVFLNFNKPT